MPSYLSNHTRLRPPRKSWNSAFSKFFKRLVSDELWGKSVICRLDRLAMPYFTGEFDWPIFRTFWDKVEKLILRSYWSDFWAQTAVLGKVNFFKIALMNLFMNRFRNGLLILRGHVISELSHHSDTDISKFHSRLFCVIGFFRCAPKISLIRPRFYFFIFLELLIGWIAYGVNFIFFRRLWVFWIFEVAWELFVFLVWFPSLEVKFVLTPPTSRYAQSSQTVAVWMTHLSILFFMTLGSRKG